jgi:hypothetical protein
VCDRALKKVETERLFSAAYAFLPQQVSDKLIMNQSSDTMKPLLLTLSIGDSIKARDCVRQCKTTLWMDDRS